MPVTPSTLRTHPIRAKMSSRKEVARRKIRKEVIKEKER